MRFVPTLEWRGPQVRLSLVTASALLAEAVYARNVLDVELDFASQFAPLFVFIAFQLSQLRSGAAELIFGATIVLVTVAVLALYSLEARRHAGRHHGRGRSRERPRC